MCALVPPFKAESMEKLFSKICEGKYNMIPERYSLNLSIIISFMLQVDSDMWASVEQLLNHKIIKKKIRDLQLEPSPHSPQDNSSLIRLDWTDKMWLPAPTYDKVFPMIKSYKHSPIQIRTWKFHERYTV